MGPRGAVGGEQLWGGITRRFSSSGGLRVICQLSALGLHQKKKPQPKSGQGLENIQEVKPQLAVGCEGLRQRFPPAALKTHSGHLALQLHGTP